MTFVKIEIKPNLLKKQELLQALNGLEPFIRKNKGCCDVSIFQQAPDKDLIIFTEEWGTRKQFVKHVNTKHFGVLLGAIRVLAKTSAMTISTKSQTTTLDLKNRDDLQDLSLRIDKFFQNLTD